LPSHYGQKVVGNITVKTGWVDALLGINVVVHCAAKAHVLEKTAASSLGEFRKVNTAGTLNLAEQAAKAGVRRFVFISSIGVNGNNNTVPFLEGSPAAPQEAYAVSKHEER